MAASERISRGFKYNGEHRMTVINGVSLDKTGAKEAIPAGRPKGARSKLSESFLKALSEDFATNGIEVIEKVRSSRPHEYLKIVARRCVTVRRWT
jgi:hypothetical protein